MAIDAQHLPLVALEALGGVVGEPLMHFAVDRDAVVVIEHNQLAKIQSAGQRAHFMRDTFHQATITRKHVGKVIDDFEIFAVELCGQRALGNRHAHAIGEALAKRACGGFNSRRVTKFGMAGGTGVKLAEIFQVLDTEVISGQMQQRVDQHRTMAIGEHEAVAIDPVRVSRVVSQVIMPEHFGDIGHSHRSAGVSRIGFLDCIHAQGTDRICTFTA